MIWDDWLEWQEEQLLQIGVEGRWCPHCGAEADERGMRFDPLDEMGVAAFGAHVKTCPGKKATVNRRR